MLLSVGTTSATAQQPRRIQAALQQQAASIVLVKHQPQNKPKTDKSHFRITELGSGEDQQQQENQ